MASPDALWTTAVQCLHYFAHICSQAETLVFHILQTPTSTNFRMIPPSSDLSPTSDRTREVQHLVASVCLACIPWLVHWERRPVAYTGAGPVGRLTERLTRSSRCLAYVLMLARVWLAVAAWNAALVQYMADGDAVALSVKGGALTFLL